MIRVAGVAAMLMASPAWAYESHKECIEAQVLIYNNLAAIRSTSSEFGRTFRSQEIGMEEAREVDMHWKAVVDAFVSVAKTHAEYCKAYPADK